MNISNQFATRFLAITVAAGLALSLSACTINIGTGYPNNDGSAHMGGDGMSNGSDSSEFSSMDIMFAQMMIPHHQQAVDMATLVLETSTNSELRALAQQIKDAQSPEIEQMQGWLAAAGASEDMGHDMGMGGMLSDEQMTALENATGAAFDKLYLEGMIGHHEGALQMAKMIADSNNAEAKTLAANIVSSQSAEIEKMKQMLAGM